MPSPLVFLPELVLLAGALILFVLALGKPSVRVVGRLTLGIAVAMALAAAAGLGERAVLFDGAYRIDAFSQGLKLVFGLGLAAVTVLGRGLGDIREDIRGEYFLLVVLSVLGLALLVSSIEVITLVVSLELSSFPLALAIAMRRECPERRVQMESAIKYIMFGVAANGIMLFGLGSLFGLTGTTSLPLMLERLRPLTSSPVVVMGLALVFGGMFYKLALFPFHFWTPDVYQGASNETAGLVASLPKLGAVAVLFRFASMAAPEDRLVPGLLAAVAGVSMLYGNLVALVQGDLKRLLGFSGIAHAGYALVGFVALDREGFTAALYYMTAYLFMVLACFTVISRVSRDGDNVPMEELAGLHRRSPLLAATLLVGVFGLAGIPPFAGFMGKLALFTAALKAGHLALVVFAVINTAIAVYYYLCVVRECVFRDPGDRPAIVLDGPSRALCIALVTAILALGILPGRFFDFAGAAVQSAHLPVAAASIPR